MYIVYDIVSIVYIVYDFHRKYINYVYAINTYLITVCLLFYYRMKINVRKLTDKLSKHAPANSFVLCVVLDDKVSVIVPLIKNDYRIIF